MSKDLYSLKCSDSAKCLWIFWITFIKQLGSFMILDWCLATNHHGIPNHEVTAQLIDFDSAGEEGKVQYPVSVSISRNAPRLPGVEH